jgi:dipeptidyl aminopeptidase/acylaminoacyl peptidase
MVLTLFALAASALAATVVPLPRYSALVKPELYTTRAEYEAAVGDPKYRLEKVAYESDGLTVYAYVYRPVKPKAKLPVVVFNRGSYTREEFAAESVTLFHRLGEAGFVVVAPMLRGSGGATGRDEMGGAEVDDVMNTVALLKMIESADLANVFMLGESRGGMMTLQAIRDGYPLRAAATYGAFTDLAAYVASSAQVAAMARQLWPDYASRSAEIEARRSAVLFAERLNVPLLLLHGGNDQSVPPAQTLALAMRLQALGKPYELVVREGANHVLSGWRLERDRAIVEWFRRHLAR